MDMVTLRKTPFWTLATQHYILACIVIYTNKLGRVRARAGRRIDLGPSARASSHWSHEAVFRLATDTQPARRRLQLYRHETSALLPFVALLRATARAGHLWPGSRPRSRPPWLRPGRLQRGRSPSTCKSSLRTSRWGSHRCGSYMRTNPHALRAALLAR